MWSGFPKNLTSTQKFGPIKMFHASYSATEIDFDEFETKNQEECENKLSSATYTSTLPLSDDRPDPAEQKKSCVSIAETSDDSDFESNYKGKQTVPQCSEASTSSFVGTPRRHVDTQTAHQATAQADSPFQNTRSKAQNRSSLTLTSTQNQTTGVEAELVINELVEGQVFQTTSLHKVRDALKKYTSSMKCFEIGTSSKSDLSDKANGRRLVMACSLGGKSRKQSQIEKTRNPVAACGLKTQSKRQLASVMGTSQPANIVA